MTIMKMLKIVQRDQKNLKLTVVHTATLEANAPGGIFNVI